MSPDKSSAIAIVDSGIGGLSILKSLHSRLPYEDCYYFADFKGFPYGEKNEAEIIERCFNITDFFMDKNIKALVLACNTATVAAITQLRNQYPLTFFGTEPGIKPAVQSSRKGILVLATRYTLKSAQFNKLLTQYSGSSKVISVAAPELVQLAETGDWDSQNSQQILKSILEIHRGSFDTLLLGCTHFVFLKEALQKLLGPDVNIIDTTEAITSHIFESLKKQNLLNKGQQAGKLKVFFNGASEHNKGLVKKILHNEKIESFDLSLLHD